jgi:L-lactate dehydrogenase
MVTVANTRQATPTGASPHLLFRDCHGVTNMDETCDMKIGVLGAGAVGSACLLSSVVRGSAREIVRVNRDAARAKAAALSPAVEIRDGDYRDLAGAALIMITAGVNEKGGGATNRRDPAGRLKLLEANIAVYKQILPEVYRTAPEAVILVVTDPPDPLADFVRSFGFARVLSTGTWLDSLRFRFHHARRLHVDPASVHADVLGEHGTSEVFMWSSAQVGGVRVMDALRHGDSGDDDLRRSVEQEVRYANITIIEGNQASQFGIGMVSARIAEIVLRDERVVVPIGAYHETYGVTLSMPSVLGRSGVVEVLEPAMSDEERRALERSAETLKAAVSRM